MSSGAWISPEMTLYGSAGIAAWWILQAIR
jgi:hypothetical protein